VSVNRLNKIALRSLYFLFFLLFNTHCFSQNRNFERAKIIDSLTVANSNETFALYLPESFNENEETAIVFIFEPVARGKVGIMPFIEASEKYNYILVCSNNSRNGPFNTNLQIFTRLSNVMFTTFKIKEDEVYTAGFSGGARFATALAVLNDGIRGVVGCGAGFPSNRLNFLTMSHTFNYVGLVGNRDMNYQEVLEFGDFLTSYKVGNEIITSQDNHKWPSSKDVLRAFNWLELQAYKDNIKNIDESVIHSTFTNTYTLGTELEKVKAFELAVWEYERALRNFSKYYKTDSVFNKVKSLKYLKEYKKVLRVNAKIKTLEDKIRNEFGIRFYEKMKSSKPILDEIWWKKRIEKNIMTYFSAADIKYQYMAERLEYAVFAMAIEESYGFSANSELQKRIYCHELITVLRPERPFPFVRLAMDYAIRNDKDKVIELLKTAVAKGFSNKDFIVNNNEFSKYKDDADFKSFLESL